MTIVADHTQNLIVAEATKIQAEKILQIAKYVSNDVEIMLKQIITICYIVVFTRHRCVIQT